LRRRWHRRLVIALVLQEDWWNFASDLLAVISTVSRYGVDNGEPWRDFHLSWRSLSSIVCCVRISSRHLYSSMQLLAFDYSILFLSLYLKLKSFCRWKWKQSFFVLYFTKCMSRDVALKSSKAANHIHRSDDLNAHTICRVAKSPDQLYYCYWLVVAVVYFLGTMKEGSNCV
jgi:hypothetical protein